VRQSCRKNLLDSSSYLADGSLDCQIRQALLALRSKENVMKAPAVANALRPLLIVAACQPAFIWSPLA